MKYSKILYLIILNILELEINCSIYGINNNYYLATEIKNDKKCPKELISCQSDMRSCISNECCKNTEKCCLTKCGSKCILIKPKLSSSSSSEEDIHTYTSSLPEHTSSMYTSHPDESTSSEETKVTEIVTSMPSVSSSQNPSTYSKPSSSSSSEESSRCLNVCYCFFNIPEKLCSSSSTSPSDINPLTTSSFSLKNLSYMKTPSHILSKRFNKFYGIFKHRRLKNRLNNINKTFLHSFSYNKGFSSLVSRGLLDSIRRQV